MKKVVVSILLLASSLLADLNWMKDLDDAYDKAEVENKIVMVILVQQGCPACKYMEDIVLKDKDVIQIFNKNFIGVLLDIHHDSVPLELEHFVTPTIYFLTSEEEILYKIDGYKNEKEFIDELDTVLMLK